MTLWEAIENARCKIQETRDMPDSVKELILFISKLDHAMAVYINSRRHKLTQLELDFALKAKGKRHMLSVMSILAEYYELQYYNHGDDESCKEVVFKEQWSLPQLRKLALSGVSPRSNRGGAMCAPVPVGWNQMYGGQRFLSCSVRSPKSGCGMERQSETMSFDAILLNHWKNLSHLIEVIVTENTYHKKLQ
jgi:hypothetical protein